MRLIEEKGNLFDLEEKYALAHCISLDCAMGAGIAVEFDKRFEGMKQECRRHVEKYGLKHPNIFMYEGKERRIVFNLITKKNYYNKPTYITITQSLQMLREHCEHYGIKHLAIPKLGCGLDRLQWDKVKRIIEEEFKYLDIEIIVRYL